MPAISVIIPTCHRNDLLVICLRKLAPGQQTIAPDQYEVIVTDDGAKSTAEQMMKVEFPWARWIAGPRRGPAANRNNGVKMATSELLAFTDDDCEPCPDWLKAILDTFQTGCSVVEGVTTTDNPDKGPLWTAPVNLKGGYLWSCNMAMRRADFLSLRGFDENFPNPHLEDVDLRLRIDSHKLRRVFAPSAQVLHPQRRRKPPWDSQQEHASDYYLIAKHSLPASFVGMTPYRFLLLNMRRIKKGRSLFEKIVLTFWMISEAFFIIKNKKRWRNTYFKNHETINSLRSI